MGKKEVNEIRGKEEEEEKEFDTLVCTYMCITRLYSSLRSRAAGAGSAVRGSQ